MLRPVRFRTILVFSRRLKSAAFSIVFRLKLLNKPGDGTVGLMSGHPTANPLTVTVKTPYRTTIVVIPGS